MECKRLAWNREPSHHRPIFRSRNTEFTQVPQLPNRPSFTDVRRRSALDKEEPVLAVRPIVHESLQIIFMDCLKIVGLDEVDLYHGRLVHQI